jgi:hypothetical protein
MVTTQNGRSYVGAFLLILFSKSVNFGEAMSNTKAFPGMSVVCTSPDTKVQLEPPNDDLLQTTMLQDLCVSKCKKNCMSFTVDLTTQFCLLHTCSLLPELGQIGTWTPADDDKIHFEFKYRFAENPLNQRAIYRELRNLGQKQERIRLLQQQRKQRQPKIRKIRRSSYPTVSPTNTPSHRPRALQPTISPSSGQDDLGFISPTNIPSWYSVQWNLFGGEGNTIPVNEALCNVIITEPGSMFISYPNWLGDVGDCVRECTVSIL